MTLVWCVDYAAELQDIVWCVDYAVELQDISVVC